MRFFLFTLFLSFLGFTRPDHQDLLLHKLTAKISEYDGYLIDCPNGLHRMQGYTQTDSSFGIIAVHGYYPSDWPTKGFEWVVPMKDLAQLERPIRLDYLLWHTLHDEQRHCDQQHLHRDSQQLQPPMNCYQIMPLSDRLLVDEPCHPTVGAAL